MSTRQRRLSKAVWRLVGLVALAPCFNTAEAGPVRDRLRQIANQKKQDYQYRKGIYETAKWLEGNLAAKTGPAWDAYQAVPDSNPTLKQVKYRAWQEVSEQYRRAKSQRAREYTAMRAAKRAWLRAEREWQMCPVGK